MWMFGSQKSPTRTLWVLSELYIRTLWYPSCILNRLSHTIYWKSNVNFRYTWLRDIPREKKMAKLFANSGDPDQTPRSARLIWVCTVCRLPDYNGLTSLSSVSYCLVHTLQRLTCDLMSPTFNVSDTGVLNCSSAAIVVNQKLYLSAKKWQVPWAPLHSMKGVTRKSSRQEPGLDKAWPPPLAPAPVYWNKSKTNCQVKIKMLFDNLDIVPDKVNF